MRKSLWKRSKPSKLPPTTPSANCSVKFVDLALGVVTVVDGVVDVVVDNSDE